MCLLSSSATNHLPGGGGGNVPTAHAPRSRPFRTFPDQRGKTAVFSRRFRNFSTRDFRLMRSSFSPVFAIPSANEIDLLTALAGWTCTKTKFFFLASSPATREFSTVVQINTWPEQWKILPCATRIGFIPRNDKNFPHFGNFPFIMIYMARIGLMRKLPFSSISQMQTRVLCNIYINYNFQVIPKQSIR